MFNLQKFFFNDRFLILIEYCECLGDFVRNIDISIFFFKFDFWVGSRYLYF